MHGVDGIFWSNTCQNIPSKLLGTSLNQLKFIIPLISYSLPERIQIAERSGSVVAPSPTLAQALDAAAVAHGIFL